MKAIFIAYNQAYGSEIVELLDDFGQRGFTHAWPPQSFAILTIVPDEKAEALMEALRVKDETYPNLGLRAFSWNIEQAV